MLQLYKLPPAHEDHAAGVLERQGHSCGQLLSSGSCLLGVDLLPSPEEALHEPVAGKVHTLSFPLPLKCLQYITHKRMSDSAINRPTMLARGADTEKSSKFDKVN